MYFGLTGSRRMEPLVFDGVAELPAAFQPGHEALSAGLSCTSPVQERLGKI